MCKSGFMDTKELEELRERIKEVIPVINKILDTVVEAFNIVSTNVREILNSIDVDTLLKYQDIYSLLLWKKVKKGRKYVMVRRRNNEDISKRFSRKIAHYKK